MLRAGTLRLLTWSDRPSLKYVRPRNAEVTSCPSVCHHLAKLALIVTTDATANATCIRVANLGGSVMPNIGCAQGGFYYLFDRAMTHNEVRYPSPFVFVPEHLLDAEGKMTLAMLSD